MKKMEYWGNMAENKVNSDKSEEKQVSKKKKKSSSKFYMFDKHRLGTSIIGP